MVRNSNSLRHYFIEFIVFKTQQTANLNNSSIQYGTTSSGAIGTAIFVTLMTTYAADRTTELSHTMDAAIAG